MVRRMIECWVARAVAKTYGGSTGGVMVAAVVVVVGS